MIAVTFGNSPDRSLFALVIFLDSLRFRLLLPRLLLGHLLRLPALLDAGLLFTLTAAAAPKLPLLRLVGRRNLVLPGWFGNPADESILGLVNLLQREEA